MVLVLVVLVAVVLAVVGVGVVLGVVVAAVVVVVVVVVVGVGVVVRRLVEAGGGGLYWGVYQACSEFFKFCTSVLDKEDNTKILA